MARRVVYNPPYIGGHQQLISPGSIHIGQATKAALGHQYLFPPVVDQHPDWLEGKSNGEMMDMWRNDHPGKQPDKRVPQNLANLKSLLRKQIREGTRWARAQIVVVVKPGKSMPVNHKLEGLEEAIDHCLTAARSLDRIELESVIKLLRRARNEVVWKIGQ